MKWRPLGQTGLKVSPYCLGSMMFDGAGSTGPHDCVQIIHRALDGGINFIDTADGYSGGESEEIVGYALKGRRDGVVLATKFSGSMREGPNRAGGSRRWITSAIEDSLRRLQVDHIDLYPDPGTGTEETLSALTDLMRDGKLRAIGSSNFPASDIVEAQRVTTHRGLARFRTEQPPYSILKRGIERELLPTCQSYGMGALGVESAVDGSARRRLSQRSEAGNPAQERSLGPQSHEGRTDTRCRRTAHRTRRRRWITAAAHGGGLLRSPTRGWPRRLSGPASSTISRICSPGRTRCSLTTSWITSMRSHHRGPMSVRSTQRP